MHTELRSMLVFCAHTSERFIELKPLILMSVHAGVTLERLMEGLAPRHCALSLVGEPIMYPEINKLVDELHHRRISTFLVTNAQFPEKIKMLKPLTQVCVSTYIIVQKNLVSEDPCFVLNQGLTWLSLLTCAVIR